MSSTTIIRSNLTARQAILASMAKPVDDMKMQFGRRLAFVRQASGYSTARAFAEALGIDEDAYGYYERGRSYPNAMTLGRIKRLTGATIDFLYLGDDDGLPARLFKQLDVLDEAATTQVD